MLCTMCGKHCDGENGKFCSQYCVNEYWAENELFDRSIRMGLPANV